MLYPWSPLRQNRKNRYDEVQEFICNTCRFMTKDINDWTIEGPRDIDRQSVIGQNHYEGVTVTVR